jgi:hypothetical protein
MYHALSAASRCEICAALRASRCANPEKKQAIRVSCRRLNIDRTVTMLSRDPGAEGWYPTPRRNEEVRFKGLTIAYPYFGKNVLKGIHVDQLGAYHYLEYWGVVVARHWKLAATRSPCWYAWRPTTACYHRRHRNLKATPRSLHDVEFTI